MEEPHDFHTPACNVGMDARAWVWDAAGHCVFLGWLLRWPHDVALVAVAIGTAAALTVVRRFTTDQDLLGRAANDKAQLRKRMREAKTAKCADDLRRLRDLKNRVALKAIGQEWLPVLVSLIPIVVVATWCWQRLNYYPPQANEPIEILAHFPITDVGKIAHLVPQDGLTASNGWIQRIETVATGPEPYGVARWVVHAAACPEPYEIAVHYSDAQPYRHELLVGQRTYTDPISIQRPGSVQHAIELRMRQFVPFGLVPRLWILDPWMVAYLLIVIPFVPLLKKVLGIY